MSTTKTNENKRRPSVKKYQHNRKSIPILIVLVFLLIISALGILVTSGLESTLFGITIAPTDGKVYLSARCHNNSDTCRTEIEKARARYDGEGVGTVKLYQKSPQLGGYFVIDASTASDFLITDLNSVPEDKIPVLIPDNIKPDDLDTRFAPVGVYVSSTFSESNTQAAGIFTPILNHITTQRKPIYMVNDGTDKIEKFLLTEWSQHTDDTENSNVKIAELLEYEEQVIVFDNYHQALDFQRDADNIQHATVSDAFGDTLAIDYTFSKVLTVQYWITGFITLLTVAAAVDVILYLSKKSKLSNK